MKKILKKFLPKRLKLFFVEHRYIFKIKKINYKNNLEKLFVQYKNKSLSIDDEKKWRKKLIRLAYSNPEFTKIGELFITSEINIIKDLEILPNDIILICVEKNDLIKLKKFIKHHRNIGINKFIILDNNSTDGSFEWLLKQKDVILLKTKDKYSSINRVAWINRIIAHYGDNRWYIVLDSDELLIYNDCENKKIQDVIKYCKKNNIIRARSLMIDMYAKKEYYNNGNIENYYNECIYFDTNTYYQKQREDFINISGGMRERIFNMVPCLTKYPLFYFRKNDIHCSSHFLYPYKENFSSCILTLLHYKFLPGEIEKYRKIVKEENYYKGSWAYKKYLNIMEKESLNFIYKNSNKYKNSNSLNIIDQYNKINWDVNSNDKEN